MTGTDYDRNMIRWPDELRRVEAEQSCNIHTSLGDGRVVSLQDADLQRAIAWVRRRRSKPTLWQRILAAADVLIAFLGGAAFGLGAIMLLLWWMR